MSSKSDYNMKIPRELADLFQEYIENHPQLGYRTISQYILHILQDEAKKIISSISLTYQSKFGIPHHIRDEVFKRDNGKCYLLKSPHLYWLG